MAARKIALFGCYKHGNFGDEVMCIMIARTLKSFGFRPTVFSFPRIAPSRSRLTQPTLLESLLDGAVARVLGGGGLLVWADGNVFPELLELDQEFDDWPPYLPGPLEGISPRWLPSYSRCERVWGPPVLTRSRS